MSSIGTSKGVLEIAKFAVYVSVPISLMYLFANNNKNLQKIMGHVSIFLLSFFFWGHFYCKASFYMLIFFLSFLIQLDLNYMNVPFLNSSFVFCFTCLLWICCWFVSRWSIVKLKNQPLLPYFFKFRRV